MMRFDRRRALVTGGGSGIGAAVARELAREGASVRVADVDVAAADRVAGQIGGQAVQLDVRDPVRWREVAADPVDLALLAAGVVGPREVAGADGAALERVVAVDLLGVVQGTAALAATMAPGGRIVAVASAAGLFPMPLAPAYGAAKWGVVGWVLSAAPVLADRGITLGVACPAWTDTPFLSADDRAMLAAAGVGLLPVSSVVEAITGLLESGEPGEVVHIDAEHGPARVAVRPRFESIGTHRTGDGGR